MNKIEKKIGLQIGNFLNLGNSIKIETDEKLSSAESFLNKTGIINSIEHLKNTFFGNQIKKNTINVIGGSEKKIIESGFEGERKEIPTKIGVNLIENSSLEDSKKLQDIWSNMLANAVTGKVEIQNSYIDILKQLNGIEITFLDYIFQSFNGDKNDIKKRCVSKNNIIKHINISENDFELIVDNLVRLNIVYTVGCTDEGEEDSSYIALHMKRVAISLTYLGYNFIKGCKFP